MPVDDWEVTTGAPDTSEPQPAGGPSGAGDTSAGKHLILMVPDFTNVAQAPSTDHINANTTPLNSYLRLGMADTRAGDKTQTALGEDLAAQVTGFTDDSRIRGSAPGDPVLASGYAPPTDASGAAQPTTNASGNDYRSAESARLHRKGGWRDHSDGNRISTTRGDKVEVIRGNYKLVVLGRQDDIANAAGFDNSGGEIDTDGGDLGSSGATQAGLNQSWVWNGSRWVITTLTGQGANPDVVNSTWAENISSTYQVLGTVSTMTAALAVQTSTVALAQETTQAIGVNYVNNVMGGTLELDMVASAMIWCQICPFFITEQVGVAIISDQNAGGAITGLQTAGGAIISTQTAGGAVLSTQTAGAGVVSVQTAGAGIVSTQTAGVGIVSTQTATAGISSIQTAGAAIINTQTAVGNITTTNTAVTMINMMTGISMDTHAGIHVDNHPAVHIDNHSGLHMDVHGGNHLQFDPNALNVTGTEVTSILSSRIHTAATETIMTEGNKVLMAGILCHL